ncbi:hypothetical protein LCGC14_0331680 [marine sediment metagenome]|uniref:DOD-type homing endonuclease domain-containing protein n=1 Tax=marine sediment metagenome TaxID=412755 RepID=A0A0F9TLR7_9ZZZZ
MPSGLIKLGNDQQRAYRASMSGYNILITGPAGTGKSVLLREIVRDLRVEGKEVAITASTGIAAVNVSGRTIHSWLGTAIRGTVKSIQESLNQGGLKIIRANADRRMTEAHVLVIDEVSMLTGDYMNMMDFWLRKVRRRDKPFGGLQLILCGDFLQLPPVQIPGQEADVVFAYDADAWHEADLNLCYLTKVFRQEDNDFLMHLLAIRRGQVSQDTVEFFDECVNRDLAEEPTRLFATNNMVRDINGGKLAQLPGKPHAFDADYIGLEKHYANLKKNCIAEHVLYLKEGAPVIFVKNNPMMGYVNGTRGVVKKVRYPIIDVEKLNGHVVPVEIASWEVQGSNGSVLAAMMQYPLKLAWALTIHKCVAGDTLIATCSGLRRIQDIAGANLGSASCRDPGIAVFTEAGVRGANQVFRGVVEDCYEITTERGVSITVSPRHPLRAVQSPGQFDWKLAPDITQGDALLMRSGTKSEGSDSILAFDRKPDYNGNDHEYSLPSSLTLPLAEFLGVLVGDGCVTDEAEGRVEVTSGDVEPLKFFQSFVESVFCVPVTLNRGREVPRAYFHCRGVRVFLEHLGLGYSKAPSKSVPASVLQGSIAVQASFLRGLYDTDGGVNSSGIHLTTSSRVLASEVQTLLLNLGILSQVSELTERAWRVNITNLSDATRFYAGIGFRVDRKMAALKKRFPPCWRPDVFRLPKSELGGIPDASSWVTEAMDELKQVYGRSYGKSVRLHLPQGAAKKFRNSVRQGVRQGVRITHRHLGSLAGFACEATNDRSKFPAFSRVVDWRLNGWFVDRVVSIRRCRKEVFDLHVPEDHSYIGNGFVNHNSQGMTLEYMHCDLGSCFEAGHAYVALSRARNIEGLSLAQRLDPSYVKTNKAAVEFYQEALADG